MISLMFLGENRNCHNPVINLAQLLISGLAVAAVLLAAFPVPRDSRTLLNCANWRQEKSGARAIVGPWSEPYFGVEFAASMARA